MFMYFINKKPVPAAKAQVSLYFISLMSLLIIITMIIVNIGKIAKDKTYTANSADAGALAAASVMAYAFNYVTEANKRDEDERLEKNFLEFRDAVSGGENAHGLISRDHHFSNAYYQIHGADQMLADSKQAQAGMCEPSCTICASTGHATEAKREIESGFIPQIDILKEVIKDYADTQQKFIEEIRTRVHDDGSNGDDLWHIALSAGCMFNMYNSGFPVKMGEDANEFFQQISQDCAPENMESGKEVTFSWRDSAFRNHTVTSMISMQPARDYKMIETKKNREEVNNLLDEAKDTHAKEATTQIDTAIGEYTAGCTACENPSDSSCPGHLSSANSAMAKADAAMSLAHERTHEAEQGTLKDENAQDRGDKGATEPYIIAYIEDIDPNRNDRSVSSSSFQKHEGGIVKSPRAELDVPTFYPPVQSSATASFQGEGVIHPTEVKHDVSLTAAQ